MGRSSPSVVKAGKLPKKQAACLAGCLFQVDLMPKHDVR